MEDILDIHGCSEREFGAWWTSTIDNFLTITQLGYEYILWSIFPLLGASTANLSQSFFDTFSVGS